MPPKKQLQDRLAAIATEMDQIATTADKDNGGILTAEQEQQLTKLTTESTEIRTKLEGIKKTDEARAKAAAIRTDLTLPGGNPGSEGQRDNVGRVKDGEPDPKRGFSSLGEYCLAVYDAGPNPASSHALTTKLAVGDGMSAGISSEGGVLVPPAFSTAIWDRVRTRSNSLLQYCTPVPIDPGVDSITIPGIDETSRADGARWGGVRGYWKGELDQMQSTQPKTREITLTPQELYVFAFVTDKLLRRAPQAASSLLEMAAGDEIAFKIGSAVFRGDGVGKPKGVTGNASTVVVSKEGAQAAGTITAKNVNQMWSRCYAEYRNDAVWLINQDVEPALEELVATVGTGGVPIYLPSGGIADTPNARLKGRPVVPIEYASTLGTVGDITLVNLAGYAAAVRGMVDKSVSMHLKFDFAKTAFRWIFEMDGQSFFSGVLTPNKGTNTLGACVQLETRA